MSNTANSEKAPRVSVLMSVYNGERFLKSSVESILGQTFTDFEFIILDDGSTDSTWEILRKYSDKNPRIVLVRNEQNIGPFRSLNKGRRRARGEYLAHQDADDLSLPNRVELQVKFLDAHPEVSLVGTGMEIIDENGKILRLQQPPTDHESITAELLLKNHAIGHSTVMARLSALKEFGGYNERLPYAQDYDLWWRLSRKRKIANLPDILVRWRDTPGSISRERRKEQLECIFATSVTAIWESLKDKTLDEDAYRRFWWAYHGYLDELQKGDIQCLEPLWVLLASKKAKLTATSKGLQNMLYHLVREREFKEAAWLMKVLRHRLNQSVNWIPILKSLVRVMLRILYNRLTSILLFPLTLLFYFPLIYVLRAFAYMVAVPDYRDDKGRYDKEAALERERKVRRIQKWGIPITIGAMILAHFFLEVLILRALCGGFLLVLLLLLIFA